MNQAYFNGDYYQCATATDPGESPATAPTKWRKIVIPREWRRILAKLTYAGLLELDGQTDKAATHRTAGEALLEDLVRQAANQEEQRAGSTRDGNGLSVAASVILDDAERLMRWDPTDLEDSQKMDARMALSQALQQVWEAWWWPALMVEPAQMALRNNYDGATFYVPKNEVYFPATRKYYLAVQPVYAIAPATLVNGSYVLNSQFWAESQDRYCGADVDNTQVYAYGTQLRNPDDGLYYQRSGSIQASGAGTADANGIYVSSATFHDTYPCFIIGDPSTPVPNIFDNSHTFIRAIPDWVLGAYNSGTNTAAYHQTDATTPNTPDQVQGWTVQPPQPGTMPGPTFTTLFLAPACPDPGSWGQLVPFDHVLTIARPVRSVSKQHPIVSHNPQRYHLEPAAGGVRVRDWHCDKAWVWSRRVTPIVTGDAFDNTATYEATPQNELVYDS